MIAPDGSFVGANAFGGALPSGSVSFDAGQTTWNLAIVLPAGIGAAASKTLKLQLSGPATLDIIGANAQVAVVNSAPVAGPAPSFAVEVVSGSSAPPVTVNHVTTIDLGDVQQGGAAAIKLAILNAAANGSDSLSGTVAIAAQSGFTASVVQRSARCFRARYATVRRSRSTPPQSVSTETLTFTPLASNLTGYTAGLPTETVTISANVIAQGNASQPGGSVTTTPVFRFFDSRSGAQLLTTSDAERTTVLQTRPDLIDEGTGFSALPLGTTASGTAPVFRFFDTSNGSHFYTDSSSERDAVITTRSDLVFEGAAFTGYTSMQAGTTAVYRFFETQNGSHFYTASAAERANIISSRPDLTPEGIAFYAPAS